MTEQRQVGSLITRELAQQGPCTWEALVSKLSACSWNQLFAAIAALSREGTVILQPQACCSSGSAIVAEVLMNNAG